MTEPDVAQLRELCSNALNATGADMLAAYADAMLVAKAMPWALDRIAALEDVARAVLDTHMKLGKGGESFPAYGDALIALAEVLPEP